MVDLIICPGATHSSEEVEERATALSVAAARAETDNNAII